MNEEMTLSKASDSWVLKLDRPEYQKLMKEAISYLMIAFQNIPFHILTRKEYRFLLIIRQRIRRAGTEIKPTRPIPPILNNILVEEIPVLNDLAMSLIAQRFTICSTASINKIVLAGTENRALTMSRIIIYNAAKNHQMCFISFFATSQITRETTIAAQPVLSAVSASSQPCLRSAAEAN